VEGDGVRYFSCYAAALGVLMLPGLARATEDEQIWTAASATVKLSDKWRLSQEVIARFGHARDGLYEIESNTLLGYRLTKKVTLWAGYTHDPLYMGGDFTVMEHRGREQVTVDNLLKIGRGTLSGRMRLEQRWREGADGTGWRLRPYVKFTYPFRDGGKTALVLSHESFIDLNKTPFQSVGGEERMRNLIAITTPMAKNATIEIGYLSQYSFRPNAENNDDHVASVAVNFSF
jgi:hypothetical protein